MFGLLNLDKPAGLTSRDAVNRVQRLVRPEKLGHAGTLDPIATGVLLICLGKATRLVPYLHAFTKTYRAEFLLGCTSVTDDIESEPQTIVDAPIPTHDDVLAVLPRFTGRIMQTPPAHSAVKIQGRRAYQLARRGQAVDITPREVEIHQLQLLNFTATTMQLEIECGSGTYIRSLGRDLGRALGTGAVMSALRRTRIGPFSVETAINPTQLTPEQLQTSLIPARAALSDLPQCTVTPEQAALLQVGMRVRPALELPTGCELAVCDPAGELIALGEFLPNGELAPRLVFHARH
ncbi:MAG: tRNA pseudouridine(55) synthase TruB [Planctomycetaceae bacterium]